MGVSYVAEDVLAKGVVGMRHLSKSMSRLGVVDLHRPEDSERDAVFFVHLEDVLVLVEHVPFLVLNGDWEDGLEESHFVSVNSAVPVAPKGEAAVRVGVREGDHIPEATVGPVKRVEALDRVKNGLENNNRRRQVDDSLA